uniref:Protein zer-1 n=1 Tax=Aceria tosichella TaxID=561515 RepID=A0A6G1SBP8_9ACAR
MDSLIIHYDTPEPLKVLCLNKIIREPNNLCHNIRYMSRRSQISVMPTEISDLIAVAFRDYALRNKLPESECDNFFRHFKHKYIPLNRIDFSGLPISEQIFIEFLNDYKHLLNDINILGCPSLVHFDLTALNMLRLSHGEKTLIIGQVPASQDQILSQERIFHDDLRVKKLVLHKVYPRRHGTDEFCVNQKLSQFLTHSMSSTLKYLDLSHCLVGKGSALMHLESLEILILHNCILTYPDVISTVCHLKRLRVLDLSREIRDVNEDDQTIIRETQKEDPGLLDQIVTKLPQLTSLDISGTNYIGSKDRNISVFESRIDRPFEFLGLFHTGNDAAYRSCIPAIKVAGEANETQILNACEAYVDRPKQLDKALNDLYNVYKTITPSETFNSVQRALEVVLSILNGHISDEQVAVNMTAALWCIVKINVATKNLNDAKVRRTITSRLLDVMHYHKSSRHNKTILINGGLTLLFLPDIICEHSRVASITLFMCQDEDQRVQSFGTTLLNTLATQVGGDQKVYIGELKAIETMTDIIKAKIKQNTCDEILETAWSTLWNITDETPANCERFLLCDGFEAFEDCMDKFSSNKEVLRNIMGLLGNVAECNELRKNFMQARYIKRFESLLSSSIDGIECSYNACGILAHLISDGPEFWNKYLRGTVSREEVMIKMCAAINGWPINSRRNINYRSFEPIVRLLDLGIAPAAQYWAAFALANLTRINPAKYCSMLLPFGGLTKLRRLVANPARTAPFVSNLAAITIYQYDRFEQEQTLAGLEQCDSIDLEMVKNFRAESNNNGDGTSEMGEILL